MIKIKKLHERAITPSLGSTNAAGLDLHIVEHATIPAGKRAVLKTGISIQLPDAFVGLIWPRSKLAVKKGVDILAGVIDSDYRGEIMVSLLNTSDETLELKAGDKCAQLIVQRHYSFLGVEIVNELDETERGSKGVNCTELRL